ncbi:hypothetical protein HO173_005731 [Letharia columbiana]|uniref:Uncharacterized protein n=1 Tax=Letharia columbiana TaxID=112416 RepID=A0A8H6L5B7_9LECA|nr:uncharacterized protein HO173_005731 [Letharia columbiana]KAF6236103.1 hypothetical protein HO173_005731 [Letharia columbiana]
MPFQIPRDVGYDKPAAHFASAIQSRPRGSAFDPVEDGQGNCPALILDSGASEGSACDIGPSKAGPCN